VLTTVAAALPGNALRLAGRFTPNLAPIDVMGAASGCISAGPEEEACVLGCASCLLPSAQTACAAIAGTNAAAAFARLIT
jgi:hypothetical protein